MSWAEVLYGLPLFPPHTPEVVYAEAVLDASRRRLRMQSLLSKRALFSLPLLSFLPPHMEHFFSSISRPPLQELKWLQSGEMNILPLCTSRNILDT